MDANYKNLLKRDTDRPFQIYTKEYWMIGYDETDHMRKIRNKKYKQASFITFSDMKFTNRRFFYC